MNILQLGDDTAKGLGLNTELTRVVFTAIAAVLAASAVSVAGLLGFVGLIVPHVARLIIGTDYRYISARFSFIGSYVGHPERYLGTVAVGTYGAYLWESVMAFWGAPFFSLPVKEGCIMADAILTG